MLRSLLPCAVAALVLGVCSAAGAAPPSAFTIPATLGTNLELSGVVAAADAAGGQDAAVAFTDRAGGVWAARVRADGSLGAPLPVAAGQRDVRDVHVVVTDRGELVVVWPALLDRSGRSAVRYAVAEPGRGFSGAHTVAPVGSDTGATPQVAALRGGTVAVVFRDVRRTGGGVLRYARRAPHRGFGPARSLGHDGVFPQIEATPGGGALLAWAQGRRITRRTLMVASARRGAVRPGRAAPVAGRVRAVELTAGPDGTAWVAWTNRTTGAPASGGTRRIRAANVSAVGPVRGLGNVAYGSPHLAVGASGDVLVAWSLRGPDAQPDVELAATGGSGDALGTTRAFDAGGFSQTSPIPALLGATPLVLFTRQVPDASGAVPPEVAAADPATGETAVIGPAGNIGAPAVAHAGSELVVAWAARGGGVAVSVHP